MAQSIFHLNTSNISSTIKKHENYITKEKDDGLWIVAPRGTKEIEFSLFDNETVDMKQVENNFLTDFLNIEASVPYELRGKLSLSEDSIDRSLLGKLTESILNFVNKYGLLGLLKENKGFVPKFKYQSETDKKIEILFKQRISNIADSLPTIPTVSTHINDKYYDWTDIEYGEPVQLFIDAVETLYRYTQSYKYFKENELSMTSNYISLFDEPIDENTTWADYFQSFGYSSYNIFDNPLQYKISIDCNSDGTIKMKYKSNSLFELICIYVIQDIFSSAQIIDNCRTCDRYFLKTNPKKIYCCETCKNYHNVNKLRGNKTKKY
jgi:hypothetical protein